MHPDLFRMIDKVSVDIPFVGKRGFFHVGQYVNNPRYAFTTALTLVVAGTRLESRWWEMSFGVFVKQSRQPQLTEVVLAMNRTRRCSRGVNSRQQESDQQADDRDDHQ